METITFTRGNIETGEQTVLNLSDAVDQLIRDGHAYAVADGTIDPNEEDCDVDSWLNDIGTVFQTRGELECMVPGENYDAGAFIYTRNK